MARWLNALWGDPELLIALVLMGALLLCALAGPWLWDDDPVGVDIVNALLPPGATHPMGTDDVGRDILARFNAGARISLTVALIVTVASTLIGGFLGILSGFLGGWVDTVISRLMDAILAFPPLIFSIAIAIALGAGVEAATIGITIAAVPWYARLLRGDVLRIRELAYVEAAVATGVRLPALLARHIGPQLYSTVLIEAAAVYGYSIMTLAGLGFVGLGAQPPTPEWGNMITEGMAYALTGQWWLGVFPGLGVLLTVIATSMIADWLRDIYDPKSQAVARAV
jgi:peptide/nickel transport system permease protein